jgi:hypothetical protein
VPEAVDVPLILITFADQDAVTPAGNPVAVPMPVAPVVLCVIFVNAVLIHNVGVLDAAPTVLFEVTVIVPVAFTVPQPPVNGML